MTRERTIQHIMILLKNTKAALATVIIAMFLLSSCEEQQRLEREQQALQNSRDSLQQQLDSIRNQNQKRMYYKQAPLYEPNPLLPEPYSENQ